jgi:hypothetical protein
VVELGRQMSFAGVDWALLSRFECVWCVFSVELRLVVEAYTMDITRSVSKKSQNNTIRDWICVLVGMRSTANEPYTLGRTHVERPDRPGRKI